MKALVKTVVALGLMFTASNAIADTLVSCKDVKAAASAPKTIEFVIKQTNSQRLGSDILYANTANQVSVISSLSVAQYAASDLALYMSIDDFTESPVLVFAAALPKIGKTFSGSVSDLVDNKVVKTRILKCTRTVL